MREFNENVWPCSTSVCIVDVSVVCAVGGLLPYHSQAHSKSWIISCTNGVPARHPPCDNNKCLNSRYNSVYSQLTEWSHCCLEKALHEVMMQIWPKSNTTSRFGSKHRNIRVSLCICHGSINFVHHHAYFYCISSWGICGTVFSVVLSSTTNTSESIPTEWIACARSSPLCYRCSTIMPLPSMWSILGNNR